MLSYIEHLQCTENANAITIHTGVNAHYVEMDILLIGSIANKNDSVQAVHIHMQRSVNPRVTA